MHSTVRRARRWSGLALALPLFSACVGMGWEDILTGMPMGGDVRGEVSYVDERRREIGVRGGWGGGETVRYDSRTRVIYRQRQYGVRELRRGDLVTIDVDGDSRGRRYARTIRLERDARDSRSRDRRGEYRLERFDGRVAWVDRDGRRFGLQQGRTEYVVTVSSRGNGDAVRRLGRLRRGDRARFEGQAINRGRIELVRFL